MREKRSASRHRCGGFDDRRREMEMAPRHGKAWRGKGGAITDSVKAKKSPLGGGDRPASSAT